MYRYCWINKLLLNLLTFFYLASVDCCIEPALGQEARVCALLGNLASLRVDKLLTEVDWSNRDLMGFLARCGFKPSTRLCFDYCAP